LIGERKHATRVELMNSLVIALGLECGFIGAWCCDGDTQESLNAYSLNWSYSFDRRLLMDFAKMPSLNNHDSHSSLRFKLSLSPQNEIIVYSFECDDLLTLVAHSIDNSVIISNRSLALSFSRYVVNKFNVKNLASNFRNLRELSIRVKNDLFLPLRNDIFALSLNNSPYPSLNGVSYDVILMITKYLSFRDVLSLSITCKYLRGVCKPHLAANKSKKSK
jgi:F-box domain